jgi:hypothetical protein
MNHSCSPNVVILYRTHEWGEPLVAHVVALRDIEEGEELCISYIDADIPYEARREALANYGFSCNCIKCERERNGDEVEDENDGGTKKLDDTDDLFGSDNDTGDEEAGNGGDKTSHQHEDGETSLSLRLDELNRALNELPYAAVPTELLGEVLGYTIKLGSSAVKELNKSGGDGDGDGICDGLQECLNYLDARNFVHAVHSGTGLETKLLRILETKGSWPIGIYREVHCCACLCGALGLVHTGSFLSAMQLLDKAMVLGLPREDVNGFVSYVERFAQQIAHSYQLPALQRLDLPDYRIIDIKVIERALSKSITAPVVEVPPMIDLERFVDDYVSKEAPCVIRSLACDWPAVEKWR